MEYPTVLKSQMTGTYHSQTIEIHKARLTVTFVTNVGVQSILRKNAQNIHNRTHLTPAVHIAVYFIKTDFVKIKGRDLILDNKDTRNQEVLPDPTPGLDIPIHLTLDSNPIIERISSALIKTLTRKKETTDLAAIPIQETPAGTDPVHKKEKEATQ